LPQSDLDRFEVTSLNPKTKKDLVNFRRLIRFELERYFQIQKQAQSGFTYIPRAFLLPIATASDGYLWTARRLYRNPDLALRSKLRPSKLRIIFYFIKNLTLPRALALSAV
jgi:phytoene synthase